MRTMMALAVAGLLATTAAGAVTITYTTGPDSAVTIGGTAISSTPNAVGTTPVYERFDSATSDNGQNDNTRVDPGCGIHLSETLGFDPLNSQVNFASSSAQGLRLNPYGASSTKCYAVVGDRTADRTQPTSTEFSTAFGGVGARYIGFYWGSVDSYNTLSVLDGNRNKIALPGDTNGDGVLTGTAASKAANIVVDTATPIYINIFFTAAEDAETLVIGNTSNFAFEFTNLALSLDPVDQQPVGSLASPGFSPNALAVPEPGAALALGAGLGLLGIARRKRG